MTDKTEFSREEIIKDIESAVLLASDCELVELHRRFYSDGECEVESRQSGYNAVFSAYIDSEDDRAAEEENS